MNRSIAELLIKSLSDKKDWPLALPGALFAIRSTRQASTKYSPIELLYGFKPILPVDIEHGKFVRTDDFEMENDAELLTTIFNEMEERQSQLFQQVDSNIQGASCRGLVVMSCDSHSRGRGF